ncbi:hypothetical protein N0V84_011626 [Fusarium piperis]|uniref:Phosphoribosylglycinamide synthetase ATP-grasp (A) domain-containing protein n=1 Tax=Fusarium piperis TaxID=1435070 RepID=A0A9W8TDJ6_9HYPO|nr:hypothetical protein N0V84_011626 [Fusarium piperis]
MIPKTRLRSTGSNADYSARFYYLVKLLLIPGQCIKDFLLRNWERPRNKPGFTQDLPVLCAQLRTLPVSNCYKGHGRVNLYKSSYCKTSVKTWTAMKWLSAPNLGGFALEPCRTASKQASTSTWYNDCIEITDPRWVVKASGLAAGKGVAPADNAAEAVDAVKSLMIDCLFGSAGRGIAIEELLEGREISMTLMTDGKTWKLFPAGQDAQRIYDGNIGPNTGGMGVIASPDSLAEWEMHEIELTILEPTIEGLRQEGKGYLLTQLT